jgi:glycerol-3-phosphate acyltransferase PlsY
MRVFGKGPGIAVLLLDAVKGFIPVFFAPYVLPDADRNALQIALQIACCVFVVAGHNWTCWLKFKGGKGIATSTGALLAFLPGPVLCAFGVWLIAFGISRYVSLASISAAITLPVATWLIERNATLFWFTAILAAVAIYKHKSNIQRLVAGTESRIGRAASPRPPPGGADGAPSGRALPTEHKKSA